MANQTAKPAAARSSRAQMAAAPQPAASAGESKTNIASKPNGQRAGPLSPVTAAMRRTMIEEAAYYIAQQRGFAEGRAMEDWLLAEQQIDSRLSG